MKLPVLMYHSVSVTGQRDDLTVDSLQLGTHFRYLISQGYSTILFSDLIAWQYHGKPLPPDPVLVTFDDGFLDNYYVAYLIAAKYGIKVNFFIVPAFIQKGEYRNIPCMSEDEIRSMDPALAEFGLHSFDHQSYADLIPSRIGVDIDKCFETLQSMKIQVQPCLAYPFGAFPRRKGYDQDRLFETLEEKGIRLAFRIGNRVNHLPLSNPFLIQRIDIRGGDSFSLFRWSLRYGKKLTKWAAPLLSPRSFFL